jgi:hypothetical protein
LGKSLLQAVCADGGADLHHSRNLSASRAIGKAPHGSYH